MYHLKVQIKHHGKFDLDTAFVDGRFEPVSYSLGDAIVRGAEIYAEAKANNPDCHRAFRFVKV